MRVEIAPAELPPLPQARRPNHIGGDMPQPLHRVLSLAFAPLHKRAFGTAIGLAVGLLLFLVTFVAVLHGGIPGENLWLLKQYFYGYSVTWAGAFIGLGWGMVAGFVAGWFFAFCRNFVLAASIFWLRTRAELAQSRDFLDHI